MQLEKPSLKNEEKDRKHFERDMMITGVYKYPGKEENRRQIGCVCTVTIPKP